MKITNVRWTPAFIPIEAPLRYAFGSHPGFSRIIIEVDRTKALPDSASVTEARAVRGNSPR